MVLCGEPASDLDVVTPPLGEVEALRLEGGTVVATRLK